MYRVLVYRMYRVNDNCKHVYTLTISPLNDTVHRTDHYKYLISNMTLVLLVRNCVNTNIFTSTTLWVYKFDIDFSFTNFLVNNSFHLKERFTCVCRKLARNILQVAGRGSS